jgi:hypothetical protein
MNHNDIAEEISETINTMRDMSEAERRAYYNQLVAANVIPFDISCSLAQDPIAFGYMGAGKNIRKTAQFTGKSLKMGKLIVVPRGVVGEVVGDDHGRIVLKTELGYLGWIDPSEFRILHVSEQQEFNTLH